MFNLCAKLLVALVFFMSATSALSDCSQRDMEGRWWYVMSFNGGAARCLLDIRGNSVDERTSVCIYQEDYNLEQKTTPRGVTFDVYPDCKVKLYVSQSDEDDMAGWGWLSRDGETLLGTMQVGQTGTVLKVDATKIK